jgi:acyl-CoA synthetase (AMP-forming)/AMP-acid ligase II
VNAVNTAALLSSAARLHADRVAVSFGESSLTFRELEMASARFGSGLRARGLREGDRVALFMRNRPEYVIALFGTFAAGLVAVPINAKLSAGEVAVVLADSEARALVHDGGLKTQAAGLAPLDAVVEVGEAFNALLALGADDARPVDVDENALAWLFYTSGTTGRPKGAQLTHRNLLAMTLALLADVCSFECWDRVLHVAPLSHGSGLYLLGAIARGAENLIWEGSSFAPAEVLALIERAGITVIAFMAPTMIVMLLDAPGAARPPSLRCVIYGGAPIHAHHARRMLERFGSVFVQIYGQGEAPMTITYLAADAHDPGDPDSLTCAGIAHPGIEVEVMDAEDEPVAPGQRGEVCVRGDVVMSGYWRNPEATRRSLRGGWLHTGDIGRFDHHGRLWLLDRSHDIIISGGTNIYPREVEETLLAHPTVAEASVFGVPDDLWGESVVAAVVTVPGEAVSEQELIRFCRERIASFKKPKRVLFVDELPKNAYGKVLRRQIREQVRTVT